MHRIPSLHLLWLLAPLIAGCSADQPWTFRNGVGLGDERPAWILSEVYEGGECGFACRPPGARRYCAEVAPGESGPRPAGLDNGARYCFVGIAADAAGDPVAVGCTVATAGGAEPIDVVLSPVDDAVQRATRCGPSVMLDAGGMDAGRLDAGPRDAGPPVDATTPVDAFVPPLDAGPAEVQLVVTIQPGGRAFVSSFSSGRTWDVPAGVEFVLNTVAGRSYRITSNPDTGFRFDRFEGGGCGAVDPCELTVVANTRVDVYFASQ